MGKRYEVVIDLDDLFDIQWATMMLAYNISSFSDFTLYDGDGDEWPKKKAEELADRAHHAIFRVFEAVNQGKQV